MTLDQLRIFIAVAEREHMTLAARAVNLTQSAVSAAIAALEERHEIKLFHRVGRGIALTETGQLFLNEARGVLARAEAAERVLDELGELERGRLRLVASQTIAAYWLPPFLAKFRQLHGKLDIEVSIGNTQLAATKVLEGEADLGIVEGEWDAPALAQWPIGEDRLLLVGAQRFEGNPIDTNWLRGARWIMRESGSGTRSTLNSYLREMGIEPESLDVALVLPSNESVRTAVEAGAGVAVLSALVVAPALAAGTLHAAPLEFPPRRFLGVHHRERYRSRAVESFIAMMGDRSVP